MAALTCADVFGQVDYVMTANQYGPASSCTVECAATMMCCSTRIAENGHAYPGYRPWSAKDGSKRTAYLRLDGEQGCLAVTPRLSLRRRTATVTYDRCRETAGGWTTFSVTGVISITNPHPTQATFAVADVLPGDLGATVDCGSSARL